MPEGPRVAPLLRGVGHVAVATEDLRRLAAFYRDVFGAEVVGHRPEEGGGPQHAFIRVGATTVLHAFEQPRRIKRGGGKAWDHGPVDHFTLEALDANAFAEARRRLEEGGHEPSEVVDFGSLISTFFRDPDELLVELTLWKPAGWTPPFPVRPFGG
jgi:catechol 2,3-dioxygenase-like lactoylglutathione lyase family enzyme